MNSAGNFRRAFTIVELLVAMAVFSLMVIALVNITGQAGNIWRAGEGQNQRRANGRALLQYISRELQMAALPVDAPARGGSGTATANLQFLANVSSNMDNRTVIPTDCLNPHALFWQAPVARDATGGDLACLGYFVRWQTVDGKPKAQLCRYFVEPSDSANYLIYQQDSLGSANWLANISSVAPATSSNLQGWFADHVIAFWARCLDERGQPITKTASGTELANGYGFDSRQGFQDSAGRAHNAPALPAAVDVAFVTLDQATALRLTSPIVASPASPATFQEDVATFVENLPPEIKSGAQVFSTRVYLQNYRP